MVKKVDIIVLGATGFTGHHVVKKLAEITKHPEYLDLKWGICGRSKRKLKSLSDALVDLDVDISSIPIIECDIDNEDSLIIACRSAKVLLNCTGPNSYLSGPVVKACISTGTHYVDISAEKYHMIKLYEDYHKEAERANVLVIPSCGFATVPVVAGLIQLERQFQGTLHSVECYTEVGVPKQAYIPGPNKCLAHYGTWEYVVLELQNMSKCRELKRKVFPEIKQVPSEMKKSFFHKHNGRCWFPYPGPDQDVVEISQLYLHNKRGKTPYNFQIYATLPLLFHFFVLVPAYFAAYCLSYFKCFVNLLRKYPRVFSLGYMSHKGPTEEMRNGTTFSFTLNGKGWSGTDLNSSPNKILTVKVSGCDPAYKTTAATFVMSAITILKESDKMPKGGVVFGGAAFHDTDIGDKLIKNDIRFETIRTET